MQLARHLCVTSVLALLAWHVPLAAQETGDSEAESAALPGGATEDPEQSSIVVTGSRIRRQDYFSQSPILTVQADVLQQSGPAGTIDTALSQLPQFTPTAGSGTAFPNRLGQALLNLRGLGSNRMLILLDGRRVQPSSADGSVDVNLIPSGLISSVETITGGASAVYGSDAITGVVNFKLLDQLEGVRLNAQYNQPGLGSGGSANINAVFGERFADDRASIMVSLDYTDRDEVLAREHEFYAISRTNGLNPSAIVNFGATPPSQAAVNSVFASYGFAPGSALASRPIGVNYDGTLFTAAPVTQPVINYKGPLNDRFIILNNALTYSAGREYAIQVPLERENVFVRAGYDTLGGVKLTSSFLYNHTVAEVNIAKIGLGQIASANGSVPVTNPFIPADLRALLATRSNPTAPFAVSYLFDSSPSVQFKTKSEEYQALVGASGPLLGTGWTFDVYGTYGRTTTDQRVTGFSLSAAQRLLTAPDGGASLCQGGLNIFGPPSAISQQCVDYISNAGRTKNAFKQTVIDGSIQGKLLDLPAGELRMVFGGAYRRNSFSSNPSDNFIAGDVVPQGVILPASGNQEVMEGFVEALIPLLRDVPFIEELNLDVSYRYSDYSTFGGVSTYKADADWTVVEGLTFRGGYSHAIRAPSLSDLFTPASLISVTLGTPAANNTNGDPCDVRSSYRRGANAAQVRGLCLDQGVPAAIVDTYTFTNSNVFPTSTGNRDLRPEKADTYTLGVVLRSPFSSPLFSHLQASIDYYNIKVEDAIGIVPFLNSLQNCFNADTVSNPNYSNDNIFCRSIVRNALGQIGQDSRSQTLNLAAYKTDGIDFQLDWRVGLGAGFTADERNGSLSLNVVGTWLNRFIIQSFDTAPALDFAGSTQGSITNSILPEWKAVTTLTYEIGPASIGMRWRYIDGVQDVSRVTTAGSTTPGVPSVNYFDLNARILVSEDPGFEFRGGVTNIFNKGIPQVGLVPGTTDPTTYDIIGRTFYVGASVRF